MGWGVNDDETFSALLEKNLNRNVYNLSVSSYGTRRELIRLEKSKQEKARMPIVCLMQVNRLLTQKILNLSIHIENHYLLILRKDKVIYHLEKVRIFHLLTLR